MTIVPLAIISVRFCVSQDDELNRVEAVHSNGVLPLDMRGSCINVLLLLARQRLQDASDGLPESE